jgi:hypothetical protein
MDRGPAGPHLPGISTRPRRVSDQEPKNTDPRSERLRDRAAWIWDLEENHAVLPDSIFRMPTNPGLTSPRFAGDRPPAKRGDSPLRCCHLTMPWNTRGAPSLTLRALWVPQHLAGTNREPQTSVGARVTLWQTGPHKSRHSGSLQNP